jgi:hydrogenase maturation protein HypF
VLGCGAEEKNTFCLTKDNYAFLSQHIGDMENMETLEHFDNTISLYKTLFHIEPEVVAHDLHPDYLATKYAHELGESGARLVPVQHHHAHIASCLADNGLDSPVIGVAFDGTGMGADGNIWGGEFLIADYHSYRRVGHLEYLPLPGGAAAIRKPYRIVISYILSLLGENALNAVMATGQRNVIASPDAIGAKRSQVTSLRQVSDVEIDVIKRQLERSINSPLTSSMGRLFDAISALLGIRGEIDYEGQAAVELEMAAHSLYGGKPSFVIARSVSDEAISDVEGNYPYRITEDKGIRTVQLKELLSAIIEDLYRGTSKEAISVKFHNTMARMIDDMCHLIADETGINQVALSGGVFQNRFLLRRTVAWLENSGFQVLTHRQVPCNDGGISLGQAVIASFAA